MAAVKAATITIAYKDFHGEEFESELKIEEARALLGLLQWALTEIKE